MTTERAAGPLREALRAVLRDFDREPTEEYLTEAERIFRTALPGPDGLDEEHCCNDPSHMSPEYLAAIGVDLDAARQPVPATEDSEK